MGLGELVLTLSTTTALDLGSTELALSRGAREANVLMASRGSRITLGALSVAASTVSIKLLEKRSIKAARVLKWAVVGLRIGLTVWNIKTALSVDHDGRRK